MNIGFMNVSKRLQYIFTWISIINGNLKICQKILLAFLDRSALMQVSGVKLCYQETFILFACYIYMK